MKKANGKEKEKKRERKKKKSSTKRKVMNKNVKNASAREIKK